MSVGMKLWAGKHKGNKIVSFLVTPAGAFVGMTTRGTFILPPGSAYTVR